MSQLVEIASPIEAEGVAVSRRPSVSGKRVYIETYGCQMNVSDSELMHGVLSGAGFGTADRPEDADLILLNTCAIREHAEDRVLGRLSQLSYLKVKRPEVLLGVCGCMAKHMAEKLMDRMPYVDMVLGPDSYRRLPEMVAEATDDPALDVRLDRDENYVGLDPIRRDGVNAWITIMRGCDKFCTFCIVPYVRGRERSVRAEEVVRQVEIAAREGFREVTLLGQTVNSYRDGETDFADLLNHVAAVDGVDRIRFTSPHPSDFNDKLIRTMADEPKVCGFIHLPMQSGSDPILAAMKRDYTVAEYLELVDKVRDAMPGVALSTDVIVGFPGETRGDFDRTLDIVRQVRFDSAFMFKYSAREGTVAQKQIPDTLTEAEKTERLEELIEIQNGISAEKNAEYIGRTVSVLVEGPARYEGQMTGRTDSYKKVVFAGGETTANTFVEVRVTGCTLKTLMGELA